MKEAKLPHGALKKEPIDKECKMGEKDAQREWEWEVCRFRGTLSIIDNILSSFNYVFVFYFLYIRFSLSLRCAFYL